jgi:hypothetical protein
LTDVSGDADLEFYRCSGAQPETYRSKAGAPSLGSGTSIGLRSASRPTIFYVQLISLFPRRRACARNFNLGRGAPDLRPRSTLSVLAFKLPPSQIINPSRMPGSSSPTILCSPRVVSTQLQLTTRILSYSPYLLRIDAHANTSWHY